MIINLSLVNLFNLWVGEFCWHRWIFRMFFGWHTRDIRKFVCKYVFCWSIGKNPSKPIFGQLFFWKPNLPNIWLQNMVSFILAIFLQRIHPKKVNSRIYPVALLHLGIIPSSGLSHKQRLDEGVFFERVLGCPWNLITIVIYLWPFSELAIHLYRVTIHLLLHSHEGIATNNWCLLLLCSKLAGGYG